MPFPSRLIRAASAALLVLASAESASAQQPSLTAGTRVRVQSPGVVAPVIGNFQGLRGDTLVVIEDGASAQAWTFHAANVSRLEVSDGMHRGDRGNMVRNGLLGAGLGVLGGFLAAALLDQSTSAEYDRVASALVGAGVGAGVGVWYGYRQEEERWISRPVPRRVGFAPSPRGARVAASFPF